MICPICGKRSNKEEVCTNCGLVINTHPIQFKPKKWKNKKLNKQQYNNTFLHPLSPDIAYGHIHSRKTTSPDLRGAFNRQRKGYNNQAHRSYVRSYQYIKLLGGNLNLPKRVILEAINLYRVLAIKEPRFSVKYGIKPFYLAFIKIACKIHDYPISNGELKAYIDYNHRPTNNMAYMDRIFNNCYKFIVKTLELKFPRIQSPNYIIFACNKLGLPFSCATEVNRVFQKIKNYIQYRVNGYILALYYMIFSKKYKITYRRLEETFETARLTISSKIKEINKIMGVK